MSENPMIRALIVDGQSEIRRFLRVTLASHAYEVKEAANGAEALKQLSSFEPNVIILDLDLPDKEGLEILKKIRNSGIKALIVILSSRNQEVDKIEALDAGADEYLTKPIGAGELLARLRSFSRRMNFEGKQPVLEAGGFCLDTGRHTAQLEGRYLHLTPTEYDVLKILMINSDRVVTRAQLLKEVWNKSELNEKSGHLLRVIISNLRDKVEPEPAQPIYILTEAGIGYRLCVPPVKVSPLEHAS